MQAFKRDFIEFMVRADVLTFGDFTTKSGRRTPYFVNAGRYRTGPQLAELGRFYAAAIQEDWPEGVDILFGPAYKGIPLASAASIALNDRFNQSIPYSFNRKEAKDHGEGGSIVGHPLEGDILIIDDVITAGTAIREAQDIINDCGANAKGVIVALDRQEKGKGELSAIQEVEQVFGVTVLSIINLSHIIDYLRSSNDSKVLNAIESYRSQYGIS